MSKCQFINELGNKCPDDIKIWRQTPEGLKFFCKKHGHEFNNDPPKRIYDIILMKEECQLGSTPACRYENHHDECLIMILCANHKVHKIHEYCLEAAIEASGDDDIKCVVCAK